MRKLLLLSLLCLSYILSAQVVTTSPAIPTADDLITLYFHADEGSGGLADYTGDIYAHIGVVTENSTDGSDWKYVKADWDENIDACKLTRESANLYSLVLTPDIYSYFACPTTEKILQLAMVFRSATGSPEGKDVGGSDIYATIYEAGLNVSFENTNRYMLDKPGASLSFTANSSINSKLSISISDVVKKTVESGKIINHTEVFSAAGDYTVIVKAEQGSVTVADTILVCILGEPSTASRPSGLRDGINYDGNSVTFVLYAPYKENVLLLGDFNDWIPSNDNLLKKDDDYWWITVSDLTLGEEYAFQYLVDQEITIADPYSEKVLDPWNDKYIKASTYPNLKPYPTGKADGIVGVVSPGADEYVWDVEDFEAPTNDKLVIYELLIRDFVSSQDIKDVMGRLDYLDELGITAIELMPVNEFEGNNSWGYNPSFFLAFDKNYGTKNDYKAFVDSCHARGIAVIMDIALNHAYFQCPLVQLYFDAEAGEYGQPTAQNPWFNETSPNTAYSWGADFDHESTHTEQYVDRVVEHWLTEFKVDGFRFDFTKGFTNTGGDGSAYDQGRIDNLKRIYDNLQAVNPDVYNYMILEHFCDDPEEKLLANYGMMIWGNNNNAYMQCAMGYSTGADILDISHKTKGWDYPNLIAYQESHDEERMMYKAIEYGNSAGSYSIKDTLTAFDRQELNAAFFLTVPGPKMIWQFGELGYGYSLEEGETGRVDEKPIRWDYYQNQDRRDIYDVYSKINKLRAKYDVFSTSDFTINEMSSFTKRINLYDDNVNVAVVGNFDVTTQWVEPNFSATGKWYEFFSGDSIVVTSTDMGVELQAGEYKLYSNKKLSVDGIEDLDLAVPEMEESKIVIFPIPSSDVIYIRGEQTITALHLFDMAGHLMMSKAPYTTNTQLDVSSAPTGAYLLQITSDNNSIFKQVMIK